MGWLTKRQETPKGYPIPFGERKTLEEMYRKVKKRKGK
jgi:hypothetical protein